MRVAGAAYRPGPPGMDSANSSCLTIVVSGLPDPVPVVAEDLGDGHLSGHD